MVIFLCHVSFRGFFDFFITKLQLHHPKIQEPFAHPLAIARQTEKWPDVVATCGAGTVLVDPQAFQETRGFRKSKRQKTMGNEGKMGFAYTPEVPHTRWAPFQL